MNKVKILCTSALNAALSAASQQNAGQLKTSFPLHDAVAGKEAGQRANQAEGYRLPPLLSMTTRYQAADSFGMRAIV